MKFLKGGDVMELTISNVNKKYGDIQVLNNINLKINDGELAVILGPSGCGKTTLLKVIAGIMEKDSGEICIGENDISNMPMQNRGIALVFQNYALFPHMNVEENIEYGLKVKGIKQPQRREMVKRTICSVKLNGYEKHRINEISGGQQQRVALARALIVKPKILLFDEPLSNLDEKLRVEMREEIRHIQKEWGITTLYVTHDQEEAMSIADEIVVMKDGVIQQKDTPEHIYHMPSNIYVAEFVGETNIFKIKGKMISETILQSELFKKKYLISCDRRVDIDKFRLMIRPEEAYFCNDGINGIIKDVVKLGSVCVYIVEAQSGEKIKIKVLNKRDCKRYLVGEHVNFNFDEKALMCLQP